MVVRIGPVLAAEDRTGWPGTWPALSHSETLGRIGSSLQAGVLAGGGKVGWVGGRGRLTPVG